MSHNLEWFQKNKLLESLFSGYFGLEIEEHRVQLDSQSLSQHPHSQNLGNRRSNPYFQTDFSESQEEIITDKKPTTKDALSHLHELQTILVSELKDDEIIWPISMPPHLTKHDIDFLLTHFERTWYQEYRDILIDRYGYYQHIMTGVHVNFSLLDELVKWFKAQSHISTDVEAKNKLYFQIAQQVSGYRWVLTYLFGAAPISENIDDNLPDNRHEYEPVRSWRSSNFGFANHPGILVDYETFELHVQQIKQHIDQENFYDKSEFYGPVRMKASGTMDDLVHNGVSYLEFRMFDIDPFSADGISQNALSFLHLLILDAIVNPQEWSKENNKRARDFNQIVSLKHPESELDDYLKNQIQQILSRMTEIIKLSPVDMRSDFEAAIKYVKESILDPRITIGANLSKKIVEDSLVTFAIQRGQDILLQRQKIDNNFTLVPDHLKKTYIQAHKLGFKIIIRPDDRLQISYKGRDLVLTGEEDLSQLAKNNME